MGEVGHLIGHHGAAVAGVVGPADHSRFEEGAVDDQLPAAVEQVSQARLALRALELIGLLHREPRHPAAFRSQRVPGPGQLFLLHQQLLARRVPFLRRDDRGCLHGVVRLSVQVRAHADGSSVVSLTSFGRGGLSARRAGCPSRGPARPGTAAPPASGPSAAGSAPGAAPPARPSPGRPRPAGPGAWRSPAA